MAAQNTTGKCTAGEKFGVALGAVGLVMFAAAVLAVAGGALDTVMAAGISAVAYGVRSGAGPTLCLLAVVAAGLMSWAARGAVGPPVSGHVHAHAGGRLQGPALRRFIATHEAGHVAVARAVGATGIRAWVSDDNDEGAMWSDRVPDVVADVAIARGGRKAVGSSRGCGGDRAIERRALRGVPARERAAVRREADRLATRAVRRARGQIRRDARTLDRTGWL